MSDPNLPPPVPLQPNERHGCLTAWLILMIVANAATAVLTPLSVGAMKAQGIEVSGLAVGILTLCAIANVIFAVLLFRWKRLGFYGFVATTAVAFIMNLSLGLGIFKALLGLIGIVVLYLVLNIGGERKAWPRLQ